MRCFGFFIRVIRYLKYSLEKLNCFDYNKYMIILISGASHTGKTALSQKLLEKLKIPYLSLDHLKMGLIRSGQTDLTTDDDEKLTPYLWQIVKEIIKTAIENNQNLIVEGCYIPFDWQKDFDENYLKKIKFYCLIMTRNYIEKNFDDIIKYENIVEHRLTCGDLTKDGLIDDNERNLTFCRKHGLNYVLIDKKYEINIGL